MISDQAPNMDGDRLKKMLSKFGVEKRHSSPYHPQGDGQAERGIRSTKQIMRCILNERNIQTNSWALLLPEVNYLINTTPNASTKYSPYKVFYGTDPKQICTASVDLEIPVNYKSVQEWIKDVTEIEELVNQRPGTIKGSNEEKLRRWEV